MNFKKMNQIIAEVRNFMIPNRAVLVGIIGILLLGFIWYLLWVIIAQSESTNNWKTYINKKYGFSFKYPSDWKIIKEEDNDKSEFSDNKSIFSLRIDGDQNEVLGFIYSTININIDKVDPQASKLDIDKEVARGDQKITIDGYGGVMQINDWANTNAISREIRVQKGDLFFELDFKINFPGKDMNFAKKRASATINNFKFTDKKLIHKSPSLTREFKKRQFDINKKDEDLFTKYYHPEVINIQDGDLTSMNCNGFFAYYAGYDSSKGISDYARVDTYDVRLRAYPEELNAINIFLDKLLRDKYISTIENRNRYIKTCITENGRTIIVDLERENEGFGPSNSYLGVIDDNKVDRIMKFKKLNRLSYGCFMPLELTNSNNLYLNCTAGYEGVGDAFFTYKINLNDYSAILIRQCEAKGNLPEGGITCR